MSGFFVNLLASIAFLMLLVVAGSGVLLWRRRRLLNLFRVSKDRGLTIFLSRLQILQWGSIGFDGQPRSFAGAAVTAGEAAAASVLRSIFEYPIPGLENQPGLLRTLFTRDIDVMVEPAPMTMAAVPNNRTIVTVGSPAFNVVSDWVQHALNPLIVFDPNNSSLQSVGHQPVEDPQHGMVQVLWDANLQRRVVYVGGLSEAGSVAALLYLARKWDELRRNLGSQQTYAGFVQVEQGEPVLLSTIHPH
jgi:hypothetical protein